MRICGDFVLRASVEERRTWWFQALQRHPYLYHSHSAQELCGRHARPGGCSHGAWYSTICPERVLKTSLNRPCCYAATCELHRQAVTMRKNQARGDSAHLFDILINTAQISACLLYTSDAADE